MKIFLGAQLAIRYVSEAIVELFAPNHDHYPATGMVPFSGEIYKNNYWQD